MCVVSMVTSACVRFLEVLSPLGLSVMVQMYGKFLFLFLFRFIRL
jgi:hypothetical protein